MSDPSFDRARGPRLRAPLQPLLRDPVTEAGVQRMWRHIASRRESRPVRSSLRWLAPAALLLVVFAASLRWGSRPRSRGGGGAVPTAETTPKLDQGTALSPVDVAVGARPATLMLSDGSEVVVAPGTRLEPLAASASAVVVRLAHGEARFDVKPGLPRSFRIEAGPVSVEVVGTRLIVNRESARVSVRVERGLVLVRSELLPDRIARLAAGQQLVLPLVVAAPASPGDASGEPRALAPDGSVTPSPVPADTARAVPDWIEHARGNRHRQAYALLGPEGFGREAERLEDQEQLLLLADVARSSGHDRLAIRPLERLLELHPTGRHAALAAVTLGRTELTLGRPARAVPAFERALALGTPAGLAEDVYARLVQALATSGQKAAAQRRAREYFERFPNGRRKTEIERWVER